MHIEFNACDCRYEEKYSDRQKKMKAWLTNRNRRRMAGKSLGCMDQFNPVRIFFHELIWHRVTIIFKIT